MKPILFILAATLILAAFTGKDSSVQLPNQVWGSRYATIAAAESLIEKSSVPYNEAKPVLDSLRKFRAELERQLIPQFNAQAKQDSIDAAKKLK